MDCRSVNKKMLDVSSAKAGVRRRSTKRQQGGRFHPHYSRAGRPHVPCQTDPTQLPRPEALERSPSDVMLLPQLNAQLWSWSAGLQRSAWSIK